MHEGPLFAEGCDTWNGLDKLLGLLWALLGSDEGKNASQLADMHLTENWHGVFGWLLGLLGGWRAFLQYCRPVGGIHG